MRSQNLRVQNFDLDRVISNGLVDNKLDIIFYETDYRKEKREFVVVDKETFKLLARYDYPAAISRFYDHFDSLENYYQNLPDFTDFRLNRQRGITANGYLLYWLEMQKNGYQETSELFLINPLDGTVVHQASDVSFLDETFRYYAKQKENSSSPGWEVTDVLNLKPVGESGGYVY
ncbi:MAG: hypothetical protein AAGC88_16955, partial [Bacteroidota bacterium]